LPILNEQLLSELGERRHSRSARLPNRGVGGVRHMVCLFFAMAAAPWLLHKDPTPRWLGLFTPLMFAFAADRIVKRA
jgi:hypothetical protein